MAPRVMRGSTKKLTTHDHRQNGGTPPSTVAAQIVGQPLNSDGSHAHLRELLQEILHADENGASISGAMESSLDVNYRLIYIIVRAGLEVLSSTNPRGNPDEVLSQALSTLAVVDLTIRRVPGVLFHVPPEDDSTVRPGEPLFLWLLPHLINLLKQQNDAQLRAGATEVLQTAVSVQSRPTLPMTRLYPISKYIQGCIKG